MIAAIHGPCVGGATNMVTFADIRYCTQDAWFQVKEAALGKNYLIHFVKKSLSVPPQYALNSIQLEFEN